MNEQLRYTLGKNERLKSRKAIQLLFDKGAQANLFPFRVIYLMGEKDALHPEAEILKAAFSVSKRYFKKAHDRNKIRRRIKETYRLQKNQLLLPLKEQNKTLQLFFLYNTKDPMEYDALFIKMGQLIARLQKTING